MLIILMKFARS